MTITMYSSTGKRSLTVFFRSCAACRTCYHHSSVTVGASVIRRKSSWYPSSASNSNDGFIARWSSTTNRPLFPRRELSSCETGRGLSQQRKCFNGGVQAIATDSENHLVAVKWNNGLESVRKWTSLRDGCKCPDCYDSVTMSKKFHFRSINVDSVSPVNIKHSDELQQIGITWSDGHDSVFSYDSLREAVSTSTGDLLGAMLADWRSEMTSSHWGGRPRTLWQGVDFSQQLPRHDFEQVLTSDRALYDWMTSLEEMGFNLLTGAPTEFNQLQRLASRVAFLRPTCYGVTSCVTVKDNPTNLAYLSDTLVLHNDLSYYRYVPGMQMMHCISQTSAVDGGHSLFVDGFQAASLLRSKHPDHFHLLASVPLNFFLIGSDFIDFHQMAKHTTIKLDDEGHVVQINYSTHSRDSFLPMPIDQVEKFYEALKSFTDLLYDEQNCFEYKLQPGEISCFDNLRILHGRKGYKQGPTSGNRTLEHGYIRWDEMHAKRRRVQLDLQLLESSH